MSPKARRALLRTLQALLIAMIASVVGGTIGGILSNPANLRAWADQIELLDVAPEVLIVALFLAGAVALVAFAFAIAHPLAFGIEWAHERWRAQRVAKRRAEARERQRTRAAAKRLLEEAAGRERLEKVFRTWWVWSRDACLLIGTNCGAA